MIKKKLLFFLFSSSYTLFGQASVKTVLPVPSNSTSSSSFEKNVVTPIDLSTGRVQIEIPFGEIEGYTQSITPKLVYDGMGRKVDEIASNVGFGWSCLIGGFITRKVNGLPDETLKFIDNQGNIEDWTGGFFSLRNDYHGIYESSAVKDIMVQNAEDGKLDLEQDEFTFQFHDKSGEFVFDKYKNIHLLNKDDVKIQSEGASLNSFTITDELGYVYLFEAFDKVRFQMPWLEGYQLSDVYYNMTWYLTKILDPNSRLEVEIEYEVDPTTYQVDHAFEYITFSTIPLNSNSIQSRISRQTDLKVRPTIIRGRNEVIQFVYEHQRTDISGEALSEVLFKRNMDESISKRIKLSYDYEMDQTADQLNNNPPLELTRVEYFDRAGQIVNSEKMVYYGGFPESSSKARDLWGYYNGNINSYGLLPYGNVMFQGSSNNFQNRTPILDFAQSGSLHTITNLLGSVTELEYELNDYSRDVKGNVTVFESVPNFVGLTDNDYADETQTFDIEYDFPEETDYDAFQDWTPSDFESGVDESDFEWYFLNESSDGPFMYGQPTPIFGHDVEGGEDYQIYLINESEYAVVFEGVDIEDDNEFFLQHSQVITLRYFLEDPNAFYVNYPQDLEEYYGIQDYYEDEDNPYVRIRWEDYGSFEIDGLEISYSESEVEYFLELKAIAEANNGIIYDSEESNDSFGWFLVELILPPGHFSLIRFNPSANNGEQTEATVFYDASSGESISNTRKGGGLRIKSLITYDLTTGSRKPIQANVFTYLRPGDVSSGVRNSREQFLSREFARLNSGWNQSCQDNLFFTLTSEDMALVRGEQTGIIKYQFVQKYILDDAQLNDYLLSGVLPANKTQYEHQIELPALVDGFAPSDGRYISLNPWRNGMLKKVTEFNELSQIVYYKEYVYVEKELEDLSLPSFFIKYNREDLCDGSQPISELVPYSYASCFYLKIREIEEGLGIPKTTVDFEYNIDGSGLLTRIIKTDLQGDYRRTDFNYLFSEYDPLGMFPEIPMSSEYLEILHTMWSRHMLNYPVEMLEIISRFGESAEVVGGKLMLYKVINSGANQNIVLKEIRKIQGSSLYQDFLQARVNSSNEFIYSEDFVKFEEYSVYNEDLQVLQWDYPNANSSSVLYDSYGSLICKAENATLLDFAYTSFEDGVKGGWNYEQTDCNESTIVYKDLTFNNSKTGLCYHNLGEQSISKQLSPGEYFLSFFARFYWGGNNFSINFLNNPAIEVTEITNDDNSLFGWRYKLYKVSLTTSATLVLPSNLNENVLIDELRLYKSHVVLSSISYNEERLQSSVSDLNGRTTYFFYDDNDRLQWVFNSNNEIVSGISHEERNPNLSVSHFTRKSYLILKSGLSANEILQAPINSNEVLTDKEFFDGIGRTVQSVRLCQSPSNKNEISFWDFDSRGLITKDFLPYTRISNGDYRLNASEEQLSFYSNVQYVVDTEFPYSETVYEKSNLARSIETSAPGTSWNLLSGNTKKKYYQKNTYGEVILWKYDSERIFTGSGMAPQFWQVGSLSKESLIDENGNEVSNFKNSFGQTILSRKVVRVVYGENGGLATSGVFTADYSDGVLINPEVDQVYYDTYYIYDDKGRLIYEMPPFSNDVLNTSTIKNYQIFYENHPTTELFEELIIAYQYDSRDRLVGHKKQGVGWTYFTYNKFDKLSMIQRPEERIDELWTYLKYDQRGRIILVGRESSSLTREAIQQIYDESLSTPYELRSEDTQDSFGYTSSVYPMEHDDILAVMYYDNYVISGNNYECSQGPYFETRRDGYLTCLRTRVLDSDQLLSEIHFYDDLGREVESWKDNLLGGHQIVKNEFNFVNQIEQSVTTILFNEGLEELTVNNRFVYDKTGRLLEVYQRTGSNDDEVKISQMFYNELSQLVKKSIHIPLNVEAGMQTIDYRYNERGWLKKINNKMLAADGDNLEDYDIFGLELIYNQSDLGGENNELTGTGLELMDYFDGKVAMMEWKVKDMESPQNLDGHHAYLLKYDDTGKLVNSIYAKYVPETASLSSNLGDFSERISYDRRGNILDLKRKNDNVLIDDLRLQYKMSSNKLININDLGITTISENFSNFYGSSELAVDFIYDDLGRLIEDKNKGQTYGYSYLGQLSQVSIDGNSTEIVFTYDAFGNKLKKQVGDEVIYFFGNAEFNQEGTLLKCLTPEGCVRPTPEWASNESEFIYDYFLTDHLGNIRVVLSEENASDVTVVATGELQNFQIEMDQFENLGDGLITTPSDWPDIDLFNKKVIQLHSGGVVLGPSHLTRVSKSQKIEVTVESYYNNLENSVTTGQSLLQIFASMLVNILGQSQVLFPAESGAFLTTFSNGASPQSTAIADFLNSHGSELDADKPQSFLVYVFFDSKLMIDSRFSGVVQVGDPNLKKILEMNERSMPKEGYFYTYVTNQSSKKVYFNDLRIVRKDGIIKQENHYYPYGLTWSKIPNQEHRNSGFQGKDFQQGEWSENGLDFYDFGARMFDPVIGRWVVPDPVAQHHNLYQSMAGNPISYVDPNGLSDGWIEDENGNPYWDNSINSFEDFEAFGMFSSNFDGARAVKYLFQEGFGWIDGVHYYFSETGGMSALDRSGGETTLETVEIVAYNTEGNGGMPGWLGDVNSGVGAFGVVNSAKTELIDYVIRSNYKSARTWGEFKKLRPTQQTWRTTHTIGKTGTTYLNGAKLLSKGVFGVTVINSSLNAGSAFYNDDPNKWGVAGKAVLDVTMGYIGFLGPLGFLISSTYFVLDASGAFNSWSQPTNR